MHSFVGNRPDWGSCSFGSVVAPTRLGFCQTAIDSSLAVDPLAGASGLCAVAGEWSHQRTLQMVSARLKHTEPELRRSGAEGLGRLAFPKDHVVSLLTPCLEDASLEVRVAAAEALGFLAEKHDQEALAQVNVLRLPDGHPDSSVRNAAVVWHARLCSKGDPAALQELAQTLQDECPIVRREAVRALPRIAHVGDPEAISLSAHMVGDMDHEVQIAAVDALEAFAGEGNHDIVVRSVAACLNLNRATVCQAVLGALGRLARTGDPVAVPAIRDCLSHSDPGVRFEAVGRLVQLSLREDLVTTDALAKCIEDPDDSVGEAALEVIIDRAEHGDPVAVSAVTQACANSNEDAATRAMETLEAISEMLASCSDLEAPPVPEAALKRAKDQPTVPGARSVVAQLRQSDRRVRCAVLQILGQAVGNKREPMSLASAAAGLKGNDRDWRMRLAVEGALKILAEGVTCGTGINGLPCTMSSLYILVEMARSRDTMICQEALTALAVIAEGELAAALGHPRVRIPPAPTGMGTASRTSQAPKGGSAAPTRPPVSSAAAKPSERVTSASMDRKSKANSGASRQTRSQMR